MSSSVPNAVGIDLGTTFSALAHVDRSGRPWTVSNAEGDLLTASALFLDPQMGLIVGRQAVKAAEFEPQRVAQFVKRQMGRSQFRPGLDGHELPPAVLQAGILRKLRRDAELRLGSIARAVITVPAHFNEPRRRATQDAGVLAGLEVLDIINEPTAAAIAFGVQEGFLTPRAESPDRQLILVYDLGGGTFDVTLMSIQDRHYQTLATAGDVHLGGMDWDQRIVDHLATRFEEQFGLDPRNDARALGRLRLEAVEAKHALSARDEVPLQFAHDSQRLSLTLSRQEFETLTEELLDRTLLTAMKVLQAAGCQWSDLTRLLLVGGATRMPMVPRMLQQETGLAPDRSLAADEAVAHGAAIYATLLNDPNHPHYQGLSLCNVNSHDLGVLAFEPGTGMRRRQVLIPRNTPLPAAGVSDFVTRRDGQTSVRVQVVEGGDPTGSHSTPIGKCVVSNLPAGLPARSRIRVGFNYSASGLLTVGAALPGTGCHQAILIQRTASLSEETRRGWETALNNDLKDLPSPADLSPTPAPPDALPQDTPPETRDTEAAHADEAIVITQPEKDDSVDAALEAFFRKNTGPTPGPKKRR